MKSRKEDRNSQEVEGRSMEKRGRSNVVGALSEESHQGGSMCPRLRREETENREPPTRSLELNCPEGTIVQEERVRSVVCDQARNFCTVRLACLPIPRFTILPEAIAKAILSQGESGTGWPERSQMRFQRIQWD